MPKDKKEKEEEKDFCDSDVTKALLGIQRDTLKTLGKILGKMGVNQEKLENLEETLEHIQKKVEEPSKDNTSTYLRFIAFLILTNALFAGIQVGQLTGLWTALFG